MKKSLLTAALAALSLGAANAQIYDQYEDVMFDKFSDNGQFVSCTNTHAGITLLNRYTAQQFDYYDPNGVYTYNIRHISNLGLAVGSNGLDGCYWFNGQYHELAKPEGAGSSTGSAIWVTDDNKYIAGSISTSVGFGNDGLMCLPTVWTLQDDGTYKPEILPYEEIDFSGRPAQYIMASCISEDGKMVIVQTTDYSGTVVYPSVYVKGDDGKWTCKATMGKGLFWDEDKIKALPTMPVDPSAEIPEPTAYFTHEDTLAYNKAAQDYADALDQCNQGILDWSELPPYPYYWDYITTNREQWVADSAAYQAKVDQYYKDAEAYFTSFYKAITQKSLVFNQLNLSKNGRYIATALANNNTGCTYPAYIDLSKETLTVDTIASITDGISGTISNDGILTMRTPAMEYVCNSKVCTIGQNEDAPVDFYDYITARDEKAGAFIKEHYSFDVPVSDGGGDIGWGDEGGLLANKKVSARDFDVDVVPDSILAGTVSVNSDGTIFSGWLREYFSNEEYIDVDHSYVIDLNKGAISAINTVKKADDADAPVIGREYYSINGQRLGRLPIKGVYLEKLITTNGAKTIKRVK